MIISASRRTDIPAFFADWFMNRLSEGFFLVRNPRNPHQVSRISLSPDVVDCIVFWSKNPKRLMNKLNQVKQYSYYFQYTITPYGHSLEPNVPSYEDSTIIFSELSELVGSNRVIWRYDPIILSHDFDIEYHSRSFEKILHRLAGKTRRCVISFLDLYKKTMRNISTLKLVTISAQYMVEIAKSLSSIASRYDIELVSCAEAIDLEPFGIKHGKCIDDKLIEEISGYGLDIGKDKTQRQECGCVASIDIGEYNTCPHGCLYCYANYSIDKVRQNFAAHDPKSPLLFGKLGPQDKISERKVFSCKEIQQQLR